MSMILAKIFAKVRRQRRTSLALLLVVAPSLPNALGQPRGPGAMQQTAPVSASAPAKPSADVPGTSLPETSPTSSVSSVQPATLPFKEQTAIDYSGGAITVDATNARLNQLIHDVAAKANIRVTGGVSDERVFGHYGPARPSAVLASLLDGTGTNMLLVEDAKGVSELVLTRRVGGATPPSAAAASQEVASDEDGRPATRYVPGRPFQPPGPGRGPLNVPPNFGPGSSTIPPPPQSSQDSQPTGEAKTPQQIYDQLQSATQPK